MTNSSDEHSLAAARNLATSLRSTMERAVAELLPGRSAHLEASMDIRMGAHVVASIRLERFELRLSISATVAEEPSRVDALLRARLAEALRHQDRYADRFEDARRKVGASATRNGDLTIAEMEMAPFPILEVFHWNDVRFVVRVETLGGMLEPIVEEIDGYSAREIAGGLRVVGAAHVRRLARRRLLDGQDAILEIDLAAEEFIKDSGWPLADVVSALSDVGRRTAAEEYHRAGLGCYEGRIMFFSMLDRRAPSRPIGRGELQAAGGGE